MAILQGSSLLNCLYIPSFIPSGSKTLFENSLAPTSWTKDTTYNNYTLRIVNGSVTNGGTTTFSSILTNRSLTTSLTSNTSGFQVGSSPSGPITINPRSVTLSIQGFVANTPPHTHTYLMNNANSRSDSTPQYAVPGKNDTTYTSGNMIGPIPGYLPASPRTNEPHIHGGIATGSHTHPSSPTSFPSHSHGVTESTAHPHTFSVTQDFSVNYKDVILATKD